MSHAKYVHLLKQLPGYWLRKSRHMAVFRYAINKVNVVRKKNKPGHLEFKCNICGNETVALLADLSRESSSCMLCGSTVRMRAIVHVLSVELFGESLVLKDFPVRKEIRGIGMSDWPGYARTLAKKFSYINTYYHKQPMLDITRVDEEECGKLDFIISSDVFEHVLYPVTRAFVNAGKLLKDEGVFIFTVPYTIDNGDTVEHFGQLNDFSIINENSRYILRDVTKTGEVRVFKDLVFHGGPGSTLEMRVFSEKSLMNEFSKSGFNNVKIYRDSFLKYGIYMNVNWSLPIAARK